MFEYRESRGDLAQHFRAERTFTKKEVKEAFLQYKNGESEWKSWLEFKELEISDCEDSILFEPITALPGIFFKWIKEKL